MDLPDLNCNDLVDELFARSQDKALLIGRAKKLPKGDPERKIPRCLNLRVRTSRLRVGRLCAYTPVPIKGMGGSPGQPLAVD